MVVRAGDAALLEDLTALLPFVVAFALANLVAALGLLGGRAWADNARRRDRPPSPSPSGPSACCSSWSAATRSARPPRRPVRAPTASRSWPASRCSTSPSSSASVAARAPRRLDHHGSRRMSTEHPSPLRASSRHARLRRLRRGPGRVRRAGCRGGRPADHGARLAGPVVARPADRRLRDRALRRGLRADPPADLERGAWPGTSPRSASASRSTA